MSDEMRSVSFQSGPCSSSTTFLPARASTAANTEPAAPAPTITASTFSSAISPPLLGKDVGQVRHADPGEAFDGAVDDVDGIVAQIRIDERLRRAIPALELAPAHRGDEPISRSFVEIAERPAFRCLRCARDGAERAAVEIHIRRPHLAHPDAEQRQWRRLSELLVDEMGDAGLARADGERVADRFEGLDLGGGE